MSKLRLSGIKKCYFGGLPTQLAPKAEDPFRQKPSSIENKSNKINRAHLLTNLLTKKIDFMNFEENLLSKRRVILEPVRLRHTLDDFDYLHSRGEVPCLLNSRENYPGIDFVLQQRQISSLVRIENIYQQPIELLLENKEIKCMVESIIKIPNSPGFFKIYLNRFIEGEPNLIKVDLFVRPQSHSAINSKSLKWIKKEVSLLSNNSHFPLKIELEFQRLVKTGKITFGDLQNILPPNLQLSPKYKNLSHSLVELQDYYSKREEDYEHLKKSMGLSKETEKVSSDIEIDYERMSAEKIIEIKNKRKEEYKKSLPPKIQKMTFKQKMKAEQDEMKKRLTEKLKEYGLAEEETKTKTKKR